MPETETHQIVLASAINWEEGTRVAIEMDQGSTHMVIHEQGETPKVDIIELPMGRVSGPLVRFLGSVASRDKIAGGELQTGVVIRSQGLVFEIDDRPYLSEGLSQAVTMKRGRLPKPKK